MTISSDVPFVVMKAVEWLKVEDICEDLADLPGVNLPEFWPYVLRDNYASDWWNRPGVEPGLFNTWDRAYIEDLENYKAEVSRLPADSADSNPFYIPVSSDGTRGRGIDVVDQNSADFENRAATHGPWRQRTIDETY